MIVGVIAARDLAAVGTVAETLGNAFQLWSK